jgi:hypothetical protein
MVVFLFILNTNMSNSTSTPTLGVNADNQAQTINTSAQGNNTTTTQPTTYNDLQYITPDEYKVIEGIFNRIGNNTLEWCAEYLHDLTNYKHTDFLATQPSVITHLLNTATKDNSKDIHAFIASLGRVNDLIAELLDTYGILRDVAHFATLVERASCINYEDVTAASTM